MRPKHWLYTVPLRLRSLFRRPQVERELHEELQYHFDQLVEGYIAKGAAPGEARTAALRGFGNIALIKEETRDMWKLTLLTQTVSDVRYALRMFGRFPGFTAAVILSLALGLSVNLTVFLFASDFFLRPLPVKDPGQIVYLMQKSPRVEVPLGFSLPDYRDLREAIEGGQDAAMASAFSGLLAYRQTPAAVSRGGKAAERTWVAQVSDNFFQVLGVESALGRVFAFGEGRTPGADPIIVLTHDYWMNRFEGDPGIVGQTLTVNNLPFTVVGVTARGFHGPQWTDAMSAFVPITMLPQMQPVDSGWLENRGQLGNMVMGRLRSGVELAKARAAASVAFARLFAQYPGQHAPAARALVVPERMSRPAPAASSYTPLIISVLMLGALLVLAVAIVNVATLLFARTACRGRELAVRSALGGSRTRLVRQLLVETLLMALAAGGLGMLLAHRAAAWLGNALAVVGDIPPAAKYGADWRAFACTVVLALAAGACAALVPALKATRQAIVPLLKEGGPGISAPRHRLRDLLVMVQVALSCVVLIIAGLGVRSAIALRHAKLGFQPANVLLASYDLSLQRYVALNGLDRARQFHAEFLERVRALPGVRAASLAEHVPFDVDASLLGSITAEGAPPTEDSGSLMTPVEAVEHTYLRTLGIPIVEGRDFAATDNAGTSRVAIINQAMARRLWPDGRAAGKRILIGGNRPALEVVGVTGNGPYLALADQDRPYVFLPLSQNFRGAVTLVVRTEAEPLPLAREIGRIVREQEPNLPLYNIRTMEQQINGSPMGLMPIRFGSMIAGVQGLLALVLAMAGIYGVVSFSVSRRTPEIGLRLALGARPWSIAPLVARQSLVLAGIGLSLGLPLGFAAAQPLGGLLYGVNTRDILVYAGVALFITAAAFLACWIPARRASRIDPVLTMRAE